MQDLLSILDSSCQNKFLENFLSLRTIAENGMTLVELIDTKRELLITLSLVHGYDSISISKKNSNGIYAYENGKTFNNKHGFFESIKYINYEKYV
jgi:hypothetical protein